MLRMQPDYTPIADMVYSGLSCLEPRSAASQPECFGCKLESAQFSDELFIALQLQLQSLTRTMQG